VLGASYFFMKLTRYVLLFWLPYFMQDALGYSKALSGTVPLAFEAGGSLGALALGFISDRFFARRRMVVALGALVALSLSLPLYAVMAGSCVAANVAVLALVGFCLFGPDALLSGAAAQELGGRASAGAAAGVINGVGSLGALVGGALTAVISQRYGWPALFAGLGGGALLSAAILAPFMLGRARAAP
jgi:sugar phosphate permease